MIFAFALVLHEKTQMIRKIAANKSFLQPSDGAPRATHRALKTPAPLPPPYFSGVTPTALCFVPAFSAEAVFGK